jgi:secondary thiamine-phosphate synthase enzyme
MLRFSVKTHRHTEFIRMDTHIQALVEQSGVRDGVVHVFVPHTTAAVTINENADPDVVADMEAALERAVPWNKEYAHAEGNAAAHVKASMMGFSETIIISDGRLQLGTWQSVYFCEFDGPRERKVWVKIIAG